MKVLKFIITSMVFFLLMQAPSISDSIYIWTDQKGVKHFSNEPPPEGIENVEKIEVVTDESSTSDNSSNRRDSYNQMVEESKAEAYRLEQERQQKEAASEEKNKQEAERLRQERIRAEREKIQAKIDALNQRGLGPTYSKGMRDNQINELKKELEKLGKEASATSNKD